MKLAPYGFAALLVLSVPGSGFAADDIVAAEQSSGSKLSLLLKPAFANASLSVAGPNNFYVSTSAKGGALAIDLAESGPLDDGVYHYQLNASGREMVADKSRLNNGRDNPDKAEHPVRMSSSGTFQVKGGAIVARDNTKTGRKDQ
jgi:hypothetical protein